MSLHKSLKSCKFKHKRRSVRKRWERFADAKLKGQKSPFGLPKEKILKQDLLKTVNSGLKDFLGKFGLAKSGARILPETIKTNKGIILVNNKYVNEVKSSLLMIKSPVFRSILTSGTIKKAKAQIGDVA